MNELEKCMAGEYYNCRDQMFLDVKSRARELLTVGNPCRVIRSINQDEIR